MEELQFLNLNLKRKLCLAFRLPPDDEGKDEADGEDEAEGGDVPQSKTSVHCQHAKHQDQHPCRAFRFFF